MFTIGVVAKFLQTACIELSEVDLKESTCFRVEVGITNNVETIKNKVKIRSIEYREMKRQERKKKPKFAEILNNIMSLLIIFFFFKNIQLFAGQKKKNSSSISLNTRVPHQIKVSDK